jgi:hypothetical protein
MFDFLKNQIFGIAACVLAVFVLLGGMAAPSATLGTDITTFTNPIVFEDTVDVEGALRARANDVTITSDTTLTVEQSGSDIYIGTAGVDLTLPLATAAAGVTYRVFVSANFASTNMTITGGAADATDDLIYGALEVAGAVVPCSAEDTISFVNTAELPGDYVELTSNGTLWFVTGQATTAGGITCTDAD